MSTICIRYCWNDQQNEADMKVAYGKLGKKDNLVQSFDAEHLGRGVRVKLMWNSLKLDKSVLRNGFSWLRKGKNLVFL
jgi:hypothetical protein